jgi:UDP-glucose 4-epimerase
LLVQNALRGAMGIDNFELTFNSKINNGEGPIRDYIDVRDLVRAHRLALEQMLKASRYNKVFNLGTGMGLTVMDVVRSIKAHFDVELDLQFSKKAREGEMQAIYTNPNKAKEELNDKLMPIGAKMYEAAAKEESKDGEKSDEKTDDKKDKDEPVEGEVVDEKK